MTKREKDRSLLRAFGEAARSIQTYGSDGSARVADFDYEARYFRAHWAVSRRQRAYNRDFAHALASAWGL